jgi:adenylate cyclase
MWRGVTAFAVLSLILFVKAVAAMHLWGVIFPVVPFQGSLILTFGACLGYRGVTEGRQKRFIKGVFAKYVPPSVVDKMIADPKLLTLGGEQREITAVFTDIAGFTTISEKLDPKTLVEFLNQYLDKLTRIIFKYGGTLDKYEGDAIIAFFGAPVALPNHREAACLAAIEMQKAAGEISAIWRARCGAEIVTRVGIHSGQAVVGNMGSDLRFDYTAIGDTMNLASRLEGANKFFGTKILASESTISPLSLGGRGEGVRGICEHDILFRPLARVKVKGKTQGVGVYEVVGLKNELAQDVITEVENAKMPDEVVELTSK